MCYAGSSVLNCSSSSDLNPREAEGRRRQEGREGGFQNWPQGREGKERLKKEAGPADWEAAGASSGKLTCEACLRPPQDQEVPRRLPASLGFVEKPYWGFGQKV